MLKTETETVLYKASLYKHNQHMSFSTADIKCPSENDITNDGLFSAGVTIAARVGLDSKNLSFVS